MRTVTLIYPDRVFGSPSGHQALAFIMHAQQLRRDAMIEPRCVEARGLAAVDAAVERDASHALLLMFDWKEPADRVAAVLQRARAARPDRSLFFLDYYAPTASPHFAVLPLVDVYAKRQVLRDINRYQHDLVGGYVVTDYLHRHLSYDIGKWHFGSRPDPAHMHKIVPTWNLGVTPRYARMLTLNRFLPWAWQRRPFALNRRFGLIPAHRGEWYEKYRNFAAEKTAPIERRWRCTGVERTGWREYMWQLLRSRIVFSPFGWGELCFRDYEAVVCGALLVKPSMEHLHTSPDIFIPHETYVPVRWDLADLEETIEHYLSHPDDAVRIVAAAQKRLRDYYARGGFLADFSRATTSPPPPAALHPQPAAPQREATAAV